MPVKPLDRIARRAHLADDRADLAVVHAGHALRRLRGPRSTRLPPRGAPGERAPHRSGREPDCDHHGSADPRPVLEQERKLRHPAGA
jgi:hypothetical protein